MSNNVFNNGNHDVLSDEENIDPRIVSSSVATSHFFRQHQSSSSTTTSTSINSKKTKIFINMATSESDSGYSVSATPTVASPAINSSRGGAADSPPILEEDTEAGPDINDDEFKSANEIFKDPSSFDFLSQHGSSGGNEAALALARQSLYVKFDPLIGGRPSIMPQPTKNNSVINEEDEMSNNNNTDLIAMNSPSPQKPLHHRQIRRVNDDEDLEDDLDEEEDALEEIEDSQEEHEAVNEQRLVFEENMAKKESQMKELDRVSKSLSDELKSLQLEVRVKRESEEQMKQVLKEYEKTISELIAEKEREKINYEDERLRLIAERDQASEDLRVSVDYIRGQWIALDIQG